MLQITNGGIFFNSRKTRTHTQNELTHRKFLSVHHLMLLIRAVSFDRRSEIELEVHGLPKYGLVFQ